MLTFDISYFKMYNFFGEVYAKNGYRRYNKKI